MVEKISVLIALEGGEAVQQQLEGISESGQKMFDDLAQSAEKVGGFKNLKTEEIQAQLKAAGAEGKELVQILKAVQTAVKWETLATGVAGIETAFKTVALAAGAVGSAVVAAAVALRGYTSEAAKIAETLRPLADLSGQAFESVSALQIAFAQGGTSAEKFASTFLNITQKVQEAAITMADDIEQSAQRIEQAHLAEEQASLGVEQAELNLRKVRGLPINPIVERRLKIEQAEEQVIAAQLALKKTQHEARVAEANDLSNIIQLYQKMGQGANVAFDPLTKQATKTQALLALLAKAGSKWKDVLADILANASELERIQIGQALGLDPKMLETLSKGSAALRAAGEEAKKLGIALTEVDAKNLKAFSATWTRLGAVVTAALEKIGAQLAPIGTMIANLLISQVVKLTTDIQTLIAELDHLSKFDLGKTIKIQPGGIADQVISGIKTALDWLAANSGIGAKFWDAITTGAARAAQAVINFASSLGGIMWNTIANIGITAWTAIVESIKSAIAWVGAFVSSLAGIVWDWISSAGVAAWNAITRAINSAGTAVGDFVSAMSTIVWDTISSAGVAAWNAIISAIQATIDKVRELLRLLRGAGAGAAPAGGGGGELASGGLIGGHGTGTSDSNLAWVSRGEHIMPARAVAQPGVLAFLEALRRSGGNLRNVLDGMGRFALGGLVPRPAFAAGGPVGSMSHVTINFPGTPPISGLRASAGVVDQLQRAAALAQVRSGGRKPSRYS